MFTVPKKAQILSTICQNKKEHATEPIKRVYAQTEGENTVIVATDGEILVEFSTPNRAQDFPEVPNLPPTNNKNIKALIPAEEWNQVLRSLPNKPLQPILGNVLVVPTDCQAAAIVTTDLKSTKVFHTQEMDSWIDEESKEEKTENFPEYENIFQGSEILQEVTVDPNLIAKTFQALARLGFKRVTVKIPENHTMPFIIEGINPDNEDTLRAAFMVCKTEQKEQNSGETVQ